MGLGFGISNNGRDSPRTQLCFTGPCLSFLPSTSPGGHTQLGSQHHPVTRSPHSSHMWE